ncbi:uncharacterized protein METZ01_LOCUS494251, partial [marine metagenome]
RDLRFNDSLVVKVEGSMQCIEV